jgi:putative ABC transport system substrate-binding protein
MIENPWLRVLNSFSDNRKSKTCTERSRSIQNRKLVGLVAFIFTLAMCGVVAQAQQPAKIPRVVWLTTGSPSIISGRVEAFRQAMRELGYVEGKNILIESRGADNVQARRKAVAEKLVRLKVDVIVTAGEGGTRAVKEATSTVPIVMASDDDPIGSGIVASPGATGRKYHRVIPAFPGMNGKRMEL